MNDAKHAASSFELSALQVHLWPVRTQASEAVIARFAQILAPDECGRAGRFRFEHLRNSFTLARGALRILLGRYLNMSAPGIQLSYGPNGKPAVAAPARVEFNTSHSGDVAVFAFAGGSEIGIDLEEIRPLPEMRSLAERFFCPAETDDLMSLPVDQRELAFFLCWTRKEAYLKATGKGLSTPLDAFRVNLRPGEPASLIHIDRNTSAAQAWTLHNLNVAPGYAAALAYRGLPRQVSIFPIIEPAALLTLS
jgi:4'-phosphopantetheinyl transferase